MREPRILALTPEEQIFADGLDHARLVLRMLQVPDPRVQLAAALVMAECAEKIKQRIEEIARQEEEAHPKLLDPWG